MANDRNMSAHPSMEQRESYPDIKDDIGEDPARFLDTDDSLQMAIVRIKGITDPEVIQSWITVETSLDRGPRKKIMAALNQRERAIQQGASGFVDHQR